MFDPSLQTIWGGGNLTAVFCDTGWEHPDTYKHVNDVCLQMGVRLITLKSKYDFVSLAAHKKRFSDYPFMHLLYSQLLVCQRVCLQNTVCLICK